MASPTLRGPLRLFGADTEEQVRVTLYRDNHAWCPYCQKVLLWLEEARISYRTRRVTMFCYGDKEPWYKRLVPSGMLPALELDGRLITESDVILAALETAFGPLAGQALEAPDVRPLRKLERQLFRAWCMWLCQPHSSPRAEQQAQAIFEQVADVVEAKLAYTPGPYFLADFGPVDVIFAPYIERMAASLFYYKGFDLKAAARFPHIAAWFEAMEGRPAYRGTQSDYHTHAHDLPPQMGGCYSSNSPAASAAQQQVDEGPWDASLPQATRLGAAPPSRAARLEAVVRTLRHASTLVAVNPDPTKDRIDTALRGVLGALLDTCSVPPDSDDADTAASEPALPAMPAGAGPGLLYIRDRINVPRDMSLPAACSLRTVLSSAAKAAPAAPDGDAPALVRVPIPVRHRRDQNPEPFRR